MLSGGNSADSWQFCSQKHLILIALFSEDFCSEKHEDDVRYDCMALQPPEKE